ncbi:MAG: hypothetical protein AAGA48_27670 [Myxococcota bacterium]
MNAKAPRHRSDTRDQRTPSHHPNRPHRVRVPILGVAVGEVHNVVVVLECPLEVIVKVCTGFRLIRDTRPGG